MPPPRLPRHLRPCHASGTAYQIRCARRTAHAQYSTTGDESPRTTTTNSDDADKRSWRSAALSGNAPWSYKTSLNKPEPQSQDTRLPDSSEDRKDTIEEQAPGFGTGLIRKTEETPAKRQRRLLLLRAGLHGKEADKTGSRDQDTVPVRKYESSSERPLGQPVVPRKVLSVSVSPNSSGDEQKQQGTIQKVQREHNPTAINEEETPISSHNEDTRIIRQQLQSLFEQVKNLQITLEAKIAADQQSFSTRKEKDTSTVAPALPQNDGRHSTSIQPLLKDAPVTNDSVSFRGLKTTLPKSPFPKTPPSTLEYSQRVFRDSACTLAKAATQLEAMRSSAVTPVAQHARNRLRVLVEDAKLEGDHKLRTTIGCIYKNWQLLYAERKYSSGLGKRPGLLLKLEVIDTNAKSSRIWSNVKELKKELARISPRIPRAPRIVVSSTEGYRRQARGLTEDTKNVRDSIESSNLEKKIVGERLTRRIHTQSRQMKSSDDLNFITEDSGRKRTTVEQSLRAKEETTPGFGTRSGTSPATTANMSPKPTPGTVELSEQSLLEELFPEAGSTPPPRQPEQSDRYPKLNLPDSTPIVRRELYDSAPSLKEQVVNSLRKQGEQITVLQLTNCSTELTEADFRRIIPKSKHIEGWHRDGDLYKVVPGRDPLSLERMPFYYLLFKNTEAAIAYQKNASRLHKLSTLHQPASIFSAIPAPKGFLEEGEDITAAISSYNLLPTHHPMSLNVLMQPYNPALRALIERGGYQPIAPSVDEKGNPVWRVLMHIEGYEPTPSDLFKIFSRDAYKHGMTLPLRNESQTSIHRLRDVINLKTSSKPISSNRPRAYGTFDQSPDPQMETTYDDPAIQNMLAGAEEDNPSQLSQLVMNRVYNRWVLDFEDEDVARRWSLRWHRRVLPELSHTKGAWKDSEEARICNTELLW